MPSAGKAQHQGTSREGFSCGQGYSLRFLRGKRAVLFTAARQRGKGSLRQSYFSVQPRALCFTQHVWHLHVANAAVRRFERAFGATLKGRFANAAEGQFFAAVFLPGQSGFSPLRRSVFFKSFRSARRMSSNAKGVFSRAVRAVFAAAQKVRRFSF